MYLLLPLSTSLCLSCQVLRWDKASDGAKVEVVAAFQTLHTEYLASVAKIMSAPGAGPAETHDDAASTIALITGETRGLSLPPPSIKQHAHLNICCEAACAAGQLNALPSKCLVHGEVTAHEMLMWDLVCVWVLTPGGVVMVGRVEWSEINAQAPVYG